MLFCIQVILASIISTTSSFNLKNVQSIKVRKVLVTMQSSLHSNVAIRKVGIIGSGIAGLGFAATLARLGTGVEEIEIFESRDQASLLTSNLGGGVQINGGAVVLDKIGCAPSLKIYGEPVKQILSRNSGRDILAKIDISKLFRDKAPSYMTTESGQPLMFTIMRDALIEILYNVTQQQSTAHSNTPIRCNLYGGKKCAQIQENLATQKSTLRFEDGSEAGGFDMIIGADGISSIARSYISDSPGSPRSNRASSRGIYSGIRITYCISSPDESLRRYDRGSMNQWLGDGCYALTATYGGLRGLQHMLAVVYCDQEDSRYGSNEEWRAGDQKKAAAEFLRSKLNAAGLGQVDELQSLLAATSDSQDGRFFEIGIRDALLPLRKWSSDSGRVLLVGDSAHAMTPFLGQGANQALQDAYCLARLIAEYNALAPTSRPLVASIASQYEKRRKWHTAKLTWKSRLVGFMETLGGPVGTFVKFNFFRVLGRLGLAEEELLNAAIPIL